MHSPRVGTAETPPSKLPAGGNGGEMLTPMQKAKDAQNTSCSSLATLGAHCTHTRGQGHGLVSGNCRADGALSPPVQVAKGHCPRGAVEWSGERRLALAPQGDGSGLSHNLRRVPLSFEEGSPLC